MVSLLSPFQLQMFYRLFMVGLSVAIYKRFSIGINLLIIQPFVFILYINALSVGTIKALYLDRYLP